MRIPIAIMSFDRPHYLERVLISLKNQLALNDRNYETMFFQDGAVSSLSGHRYATDEVIETNTLLFQRLFPDGKVIKSAENLGVALNFERAEEYIFEILKAPYGIFLEDDMELSPIYLTVMHRLAKIALQDERIGYFAAYGNHRLSAAEQTAKHMEFFPMDHNWAFGLTRRQWLKSKPYVDDYLKIVRKQDYGQRPNDQIRELFESWGCKMPGSSQDVAKTLACYVTGGTKVNTAPVYGRYIGAKGIHATPEWFTDNGFDATELADDPEPFSRDGITEDEIANLRLEIEKYCQTDCEDCALTESSKHQPPPPEPYFQNPNRAGAFEKLSHDLFGKDPYEGFQSTIAVHDLQGWNGLHPVLSRAVKDKKPKIIVDVGVWKGQSTITLAKAQSEAIDDGCVIAVDTFLGSPEHWTLSRPEIHQSLAFRHGRPSFYETFLSNVLLSGFQRKVLPLAQTSENAAHILRRHCIMADIVHIDAAHEYASALRDIEVWWELLRPGGLLIGDDFPWPGVARAVVHFTDKMNIPFQVEHPKWLIGKSA